MNCARFRAACDVRDTLCAVRENSMKLVRGSLANTVLVPKVTPSHPSFASIAEGHASTLSACD